MNPKIRKILEEQKRKADHEWKYHKVSSFIFAFGLFLFLGLTLLAVEAIKSQVALPAYIVTGLVVLMGAWLVFKFWSNMSNITHEEEEEKEKISIEAK